MFYETDQFEMTIEYTQKAQEIFEEEFNFFFDADVYKYPDSINLYINEFCRLK
jgi:hypothetical protein